jgi:hypothetical protein
MSDTKDEAIQAYGQSIGSDKGLTAYAAIRATGLPFYFDCRVSLKLTASLWAGRTYREAVKEFSPG